MYSSNAGENYVAAIKRDAAIIVSVKGLALSLRRLYHSLNSDYEQKNIDVFWRLCWSN